MRWIRGINPWKKRVPSTRSQTEHFSVGVIMFCQCGNEELVHLNKPLIVAINIPTKKEVSLYVGEAGQIVKSQKYP